MRLQPDIAAAASDTSLANYALAILALDRLSAERVGTENLRMPKQLVNYSSDSMVQNQFHTQQQLLLDRLKTNNPTKIRLETAEPAIIAILVLLRFLSNSIYFVSFEVRLYKNFHFLFCKFHRQQD